MVDESLFPVLAPVLKRVAPYVAVVLVGGAGLGYAVHEHRAAQTSATQNEQATAELQATQKQLADLTAKVNALTVNTETKPSAAEPATGGVTSHHTATSRAHPGDRHLSKLQSQVDAQGKEIEETRGDLANTRTELTGSIARTHNELVLLEKKGERSYFEFDILKSKQFHREGPVEIRLKKANTKHQYADLELLVDDRNVTQKHINIFQPVMYYQSDSQQPMEVVINSVTKNHIHGYVSAPKYRQSELTAMSDANAAANSNAGSGSDQAANSVAQPAPRKELTVPPQ